MSDHSNTTAAESMLPRRDFLASLLAAGGLACFGPRASWGAAKPLRVAVVTTEFTYRSHAHVIVENFLNPYLFRGEVVVPDMELVSFYIDQFPERDMGRAIAKERGIPIFPTIGEALRVGGDSLAVDAVLSIGEHGSYPTNEKGQVTYPRKRFFDGIVAEFRRSGRSVPVFNDKHLSYRSNWAIEMVNTAREMGFPFMAGSSVPLAQRRPMIEMPAGAKVVEAISIHGGGLESYDFHGLEVLQSMVESRAGGEKGVRSVRFLSPEEVWKAADDGLWTPELADAALASEPDQPLKGSLREQAKQGRSFHGILVEYVDGLRGLMINAAATGTRWHFAARLEGQSDPIATSFHVGPWDNRNLFKALSHAIQECFRSGKAPYPVERTLLTTLVLDAAMDSRQASGAAIVRPELQVAYTPRDFSAMRENGSSWDILKADSPQPEGLDEFGKRLLAGGGA